MMFNVCYALGELAVMYPVSGAFYTYSARFVDPSWGFAMGWNYVFQWAVVLPLEITVAVTTVQYWGEDLMPVAAWITVFWIVISESFDDGISNSGLTIVVISNRIPIRNSGLR